MWADTKKYFIFSDYSLGLKCADQCVLDMIECYEECDADDFNCRQVCGRDQVNCSNGKIFRSNFQSKNWNYTFQDCPCHAHCIDGCNGCNNRICTCDESVLDDDPAYSRLVLLKSAFCASAFCVALALNTVYGGWQWCWWHRDVGDFMLVTILGCWWQKNDVGDIFLHVGDMPIGHQHNYRPECDVGDRFVMLETFFWSWWH